MSEFDIWAGEDGLNPESDWTIKSAKFEPHAQWGDEPVLKLTVDVSVDDVVVSQDREQLIGIGPGWKAIDDGQRVERLDGGEKSFNKQTSYYKFFAGAIEVLGNELKDKDPRNADTWVGYSFHMKRTLVGKKQDGGDRNVEIPVGKGSGTSTGSTSSPSASLDSTTLSKLEELAKANDDHDAFMMAALELDGVAGSAEAEKIIGNSGADGLWAQARATA